MNYIEWGYASGTAYNSLLLTSKKVKMNIINIKNLENRKDTNEKKIKFNKFISYDSFL